MTPRLRLGQRGRAGEVARRVRGDERAGRESCGSRSTSRAEFLLPRATPSGLTAGSSQTGARAAPPSACACSRRELDQRLDARRLVAVDAAEDQQRRVRGRRSGARGSRAPPTDCPSARRTPSGVHGVERASRLPAPRDPISRSGITSAQWRSAARPEDRGQDAGPGQAVRGGAGRARPHAGGQPAGQRQPAQDRGPAARAGRPRRAPPTSTARSRCTTCARATCCRRSWAARCSSRWAARSTTSSP